MKEQIKIDIPEGKVPVLEQTKKGIVITWREKEYSYNDIVKILQKDFHNSYIENLLSLEGFVATKGSDSSDTNIFYKKVEVLRKLINIRNYFGKPSNKNDYDYGWVISSNGTTNKTIVEYPHLPVFAKKEHAEQAIKMLGDELKYLFESW